MCVCVCDGTNVKYTEMMPEAKFNLFKVKLPEWKNQYYLIGYKGKLAQNGARHSEEFAGIPHIFLLDRNIPRIF